MTQPPEILCFGFSYCAQSLAPLLRARGFQIAASCRDPKQAARLEAAKVRPVPLPLAAPEAVASATHVLLSAPPDDGDPILATAGDALAASDTLTWLGYLSTTAVYGNTDGAWVDEDTPPPDKLSARGQRRLAAEEAWRAFADRHGVPLDIFRLAGIYGHTRNALAALKTGRARRIHKPDQVFSRIHVEDIAQVLAAAIEQGGAGNIYNVCDDAPAPPQDVVAYAAELLGVAPPPLEDFATADMSEMARAFYGDNRRVRNRRIKEMLGVQLAYPTYREGLQSLFATGDF